MNRLINKHTLFLIIISFFSSHAWAAASCNNDQATAYVNESKSIRLLSVFPEHGYPHFVVSVYLNDVQLNPSYDDKKAGIVNHTFKSSGNYNLKTIFKISYPRGASEPIHCSKTVKVIERPTPSILTSNILPQESDVKSGTALSVDFIASNANKVVLQKKTGSGVWVDLSTCNKSECTATGKAEGYTTHSIKGTPYYNNLAGVPRTVTWSSVGVNTSPSVSLSVSNNLVNRNEPTQVTITASDQDDNPAFHISDVQLQGVNGTWVSYKAQCLPNEGNSKSKSVSCSFTTGNLSSNTTFKARVKDSGGWVESDQHDVSINIPPSVTSLIVKSGTTESIYFRAGSEISITTSAQDANGNLDNLQICVAKGVTVDTQVACGSSAQWANCNADSCTAKQTLSEPGPYIIYSRVTDTMGQSNASSPHVVYVLSDFGIYIEPDSVAQEYIVDDPNNPPTITWHVVANQVYATGNKVAGFRILPYGNTSHAITPSVPELENGPQEVSEACHTGQCRFTLKWQPTSASYGSPIGFSLLAIDSKNGTVQARDVVQTIIATRLPHKPPVPNVTVKLNEQTNQYQAQIAGLGNASKTSILVRVGDAEATYSHNTNTLWNVPGTSYTDNGKALTVCVTGIAEGENGNSFGEPGCSSVLYIDHNDTPEWPAFDMALSQFGGPYTLNWYPSTDGGLTSYYQLYRWAGHIADEPAQPELVQTGIKGTSVSISNIFKGTYTYRLSACNLFDECTDSSPFVVEHIAPIVASASVNEVEQRLVLGGAGFSLDKGRLFTQIENTSETYEISDKDISVSAQGGVLTAKLSERLVSGYKNKGLIIEYRNQVECPSNDENDNYVGKVLCVDHRLTYKARVDDQSPDTIIDMTENNFTVSDSGYVYVGGTQPASDQGSAPFYQVKGASEDITGLYIYKQGSNNTGWVFSTDDTNAQTDDHVVGKPLVLTKSGIDHVYFGAQNHKVYKFTHNPKTLADNRFNYIWQQVTGGANTAGLQTDEIGNIYVGSMDQRLYSLLPDTGQVNWHYSFAPSGGIVALSGVGQDGLALVTTQDGEMNWINRRLIDKNAVSWSRLDDYLEMENPGWAPPQHYLEANIIGHLLAAIHDRLPSRREIAALSYAHMHGHSLEEVINAILNARIEAQSHEPDAQALYGADNYAFARVLISRLLNQDVELSTVVHEKTVEQWAALLDNGTLRRAELVLLLQQPTYFSYSDSVQELLNLYFGYCFGSACNYNTDTDGDGIPNLVEIANNTNVNDPRDGFEAPTMRREEIEGLEAGTLLFSLQSRDEIGYYKVFYRVNNGPFRTLDVPVSGGDSYHSTSWQKTVSNGDYDFYAKACKKQQLPFETYEVCSNSGSDMITVNVSEYEGEAVPNIELDTIPELADISLVDLRSNAELTPTVGSFRVSEAGSATYSFPVELPQGIAGVTPSVSLSYNSQAGDSSVALGWSLNAGSSITRCRPTMAIDGYSAPVQFDDTDKYCLDGQRLIEVDSIDWPLSVTGTVQATYVLEKDAQLLIEKRMVDGQPYFIVYGKDGSKKYYGGSSKNEVRVGRDNQSMATLTWLLHSEYDSTHSEKSVVKYTYNDSDMNGIALGDGEKVLTKISYSNYSVEFDYTAREVRGRSYMNYGSLSQRARLDKISVNTTGSTFVELSHYDIAGNSTQPNSSGPRRLDAIQQCRGDVCKQPITFDYNDLASPHSFDNRKELFAVDHSGGYSGNKLAGFTFLDTQGNGYLELATLERKFDSDQEYQLCIWKGQTVDNELKLGCTDIKRSDNAEQVSMVAVDVEGDGSQSLWINIKSDYEENYRSYYWQKVDFDGDTFITEYPDIKNLSGKFIREIKVADFDGDGYSDIAYKKNRDDHNLYVSVWDRRTKLFIDEVAITTGNDKEAKVTEKGSDWQVADINFDGLADIVALKCANDSCEDGKPNRLYAHLNNGAGKSFTQSIIAPWNHYFKQFMLTDINSDGFLDILLQRADGEGSFFWNAYLSIAAINDSGSYTKYRAVAFSLDGETDTSLSTASAELNENVSPFVIDSDRNGINELYFKEAGQANYLWRKFDWDPEAEVIKRSSVRFETWGFDAEQGSVVFPADFDNNGAVDLIQKLRNTLYVHYDYQQPTQAGLLRTITQGYGSKTQIHYTPMNTEGSAAVYSRTLSTLPDEMQDILEDTKAFADPEHKVMDLMSSMPLVSSVETDSPITGSYESEVLTVNYHYYDAKVQFGGRGMLGFGAITTTTEKDQIKFKTTTRYHQAFPYTGMPKVTEKRLGPKLISLSVNQYDYLQDKHARSYQVFVHKSRECSTRFDSVNINNRSHASAYNPSGYSCTKTVSDEDVWGNVFTNTVTQYDVLPVNVNAFTYYGWLSANTKLAATITSNCYGQACDSSYSDASDYIKLGRLTQVTVEHLGSDSDPLYIEDKVTKKSEFAYYQSGPEKFLLKEEKLNVGAGSDHELTKYYTYDEVGNIKTITSSNSGNECASDDALCRVITYHYDANMHFVESTSNDYFTPSTVVSRNAFGQPTKVISVDEVISTTLYDIFGTKVGTHSSTGAQSYSYLTSCDSVEVHCAVQQNTVVNGVLVEKQYMDISGRIYAVHKRGKKDDHWFVSETGFDQHGRVIYQKAPGQKAVVTEYDVFDRVISVNDPNSGTSTSHTQVGQESTVTVSLDGDFSLVDVDKDKGLPGGAAHSQTTVKDLLGRNYKVIDNAGNELTYDYDVLGNNTTVHSSADNKVVVTNGYDAQGRLEYRETLDNGKWSYKYNAFGEVYEQTDARDVTTYTEYDKLGRKISQYQAFASNTLDDEEVKLEGRSTWSYSAEVEEGSKPSEVTHQLHYVTQGGWKKNYYYDKQGRLASTLTDLDNNMCSAKVAFNKTTADLRYTDAELADAVQSLCVIQQKFYDSYGRDTYQFDDYRRSHSNHDYSEARGIKKIYNEYGVVVALQEARDTVNGIKYYEVDTGAVNERGLVTRYRKGLAEMSLAYDSQGMITAIDARYNQGHSETPYLQGDRYRFDSLGNLTYRSALGLSQSQKFGYDNLNRITSINGVEKYQYCNNGNLKLKDGWDLVYGDGECNGHRLTERVRETTSSGPGGDFKPFSADMLMTTSTANPDFSQHEKETFGYDANGNEIWMKQSGTIYRSQVYSGRNKVVELKGNGNKQVTFAYDANNRRYMRQDEKQTVYYVGALELTTRTVNSEKEQFIRRYIGNEAVQIYYSGSGRSKLQWLFTDHQGSVTAVTDSNYKLLARYSYDVFGKRIEHSVTGTHQAEFKNLTLFSTIAPNMRAYTGHEPIALGQDDRVIHMNGRVYDSATGRFMQADPVVQAPGNLQNYNAYSYVLNNPLSYTDPSGYFFKKLLKGVMKATGTWQLLRAIADNQFMSMFVQIGLALIPGCQSGVCHAVFNAATTFAVTGSLNAGLKAGAISYAQSTALQKIGGSKTWGKAGSIENIAANALVGGVASELQGGKFGHGFLSAGVASAFKPMLNDIGGAQSANSAIKTGNVAMLAKFQMHRIVGAAVIGGTTSVISGGKFANGAISGAFNQAFNGEVSLQHVAMDSAQAQVDYIRELWEKGGENNKFEAKLRYATMHELVYGEGKQYSTNKLQGVMGHMNENHANTRLLELSQGISRLSIDKLSSDVHGFANMYSGGKPSTILKGAGGGVGFFVSNYLALNSLVDHNSGANAFMSQYNKGMHDNFTQLFNDGKL